jgi:cupin fold WbuC family metalloprotein
MDLPGVQLIDRSLIERITAGARTSSRGRMNHNFHSSPDAPVHRFLNVLTRATYVQPHRHRDPPKHESFLVLEGRIAVFVFSDEGAVLSAWILGGDISGIDLPAGAWHTVVALTDTAVCYEVKPGPWDSASDKEFAAWAPREGDPNAEAYRMHLLEHIHDSH